LNYLLGLALNCDPPDLCLLSSWDYRREPPVSTVASLEPMHHTTGGRRFLPLPLVSARGGRTPCLPSTCPQGSLGTSGQPPTCRQRLQKDSVRFSRALLVSRPLEVTSHLSLGKQDEGVSVRTDRSPRARQRQDGNRLQRGAGEARASLLGITDGSPQPQLLWEARSN
jgi:hypothetical protein